MEVRKNQRKKLDYMKPLRLCIWTIQSGMAIEREESSHDFIGNGGIEI